MLITFKTIIDGEIVERYFPLINSSLLIKDVQSLLWQKNSSNTVYIVDELSENDRLALTELEIILTKHIDELSQFDEEKVSL